jgi:hypothetical protein
VLLLIPNLDAVARTVALFSIMYSASITERSLPDDKYIIIGSILPLMAILNWCGQINFAPTSLHYFIQVL